MGRPALPGNVHRLNNRSKLSEQELEARNSNRVPVEIPACPAHLDTDARAEWKRITPHLVTAGLITQMDRAALAGYCQAWGEWAQAERDLKEKRAQHGIGVLVDVTPSGYKQVSAAAQVRDRALDRMLRFAKEFGLTPASRIQSTTGQQLGLPGVDDDPMEAFLNAGAGVANAR